MLGQAVHPTVRMASSRVWVIEQAFGLEHLALKERPLPEPGFGQVRVRVRACSINYRDLMVVKGSYNPRMPLPRVPFSDGAGEVEAVGPGVRRWKPGDRVIGSFFQAWLAGPLEAAYSDSTLGGAIDGMLAEHVALHEDGLVALPEHLSFEEAATLPCAAVTAWNGLFESGATQPGDTVLVQGSGGVSVFALQFARLAGATVIATTSSEEKAARLREMGAADVINYRDTPEWGKRVREITGRRGADTVVEVGGAGTLGQSLTAVRTGGYVALIGVLSGGAGEVPTAKILMQGVRVQGIYVGSRATFEAMNRALSAHRLRPVVDRTFPFDQAVDALRHMESQQHFGKVVVAVG